MRRGLMAWDAEEVPREALEERVQRLQAAMSPGGQDAMLLYTNFIRSAAVSYVTGFSPYWADGVLLVPHDGEPLFATTLSKRVGSWIETVKPVGNLVNSPTPGKVVAARLMAHNAKRVAVLELDDFPSGLYDDIRTALPEAEIVDGSGAFASARGTLDAVERRLLQKANAIAAGALDQIDMRTAPHLGEVVGAVEKSARLQGAEEVYVAIAPNLDADRRFVRLSGEIPLGRRFAVRATVAYKGAWVRRIKTYARDGAVSRADAWFKDMLDTLNLKRPLGLQIASAVTALSGARAVSWMAEAPVGTRPLAVVASADTPDNGTSRHGAVILTIGLMIDGALWCAARLVVQ